MTTSDRDFPERSDESPEQARYAFAEPATGGEAFVPRPEDATRTARILNEAARWYGGRMGCPGFPTEA